MHLSGALLVLPLTLAAHLRVSIAPSKALANPSSLPPSTTASLTTLSSIHTSPLRVDNSFSFPNLTTGSYLLDISCSTHAFAPMRVDVSEGIRIENGAQKLFSEVQAWGTFRGNEWSNKGEEAVLKAGEYGLRELEVKAGVEKSYFVERAGFNPMSLLQNPMILMMGFAMVIVFGVPYMMDNMDPELKEEFQERQKQGLGLTAMTGGQAPPNPLQDFDAAAWLAGSSSKKGNAVVEKRASK